MIDKLNSDALNVRNYIRQAEGVTDEALEACANLKLALLQAKRNPEFGVATGHTALVRLQRAEQLFMQARGDLLRVHAELSDVARETASIDDGTPTEVTGFQPEPLLEAA